MADCDVCGAQFMPDLHSRCEKCRRICCRDCMKIVYEPNALTGISRILGVRCYHCHHLGNEGNEKSS